MKAERRNSHCFQSVWGISTNQSRSIWPPFERYEETKHHTERQENKQKTFHFADVDVKYAPKEMDVWPGWTFYPFGTKYSTENNNPNHTQSFHDSNQSDSHSSIIRSPPGFNPYPALLTKK